MSRRGRPRREKIPIEERFWPKVEKRGDDDCWLWIAGRRGNYGCISYRGKSDGAHRVSYMINVGEIPDGLDVLHKCDVPLCVNPKHLFVGTSRDNAIDMWQKGRQHQTHFPPNKKLDPDKVREMRALSAAGISQREIARRFQVTQPTVYYAIHGISWRKVE